MKGAIEMKYFKYCVAVCAIGLVALTLGATSAPAQVRFGIGIGGPGYGAYYGGGPYYGNDPYYGNAPDYGSEYYGAEGAPYGPPPACSYGYYPYYPYACAPYGYWAPDYFYDGFFVGAGPWFGWGFGPGFRTYFHNF